MYVVVPNGLQPSIWINGSFSSTSTPLSTFGASARHRDSKDKDKDTLCVYCTYIHIVPNLTMQTNE